MDSYRNHSRSPITRLIVWPVPAVIKVETLNYCLKRRGVTVQMNQNHFDVESDA